MKKVSPLKTVVVPTQHSPHTHTHTQKYFLCFFCLLLRIKLHLLFLFKQRVGSDTSACLHSTSFVFNHLANSHFTYGLIMLNKPRMCIHALACILRYLHIAECQPVSAMDDQK